MSECGNQNVQGLAEHVAKNYVNDLKKQLAAAQSEIQRLKEENERLHLDYSKGLYMPTKEVELRKAVAYNATLSSRLRKLREALKNIANGYMCCDASANAKEALTTDAEEERQEEAVAAGEEIPL